MADDRLSVSVVIWSVRASAYCTRVRYNWVHGRFGGTKEDVLAYCAVRLVLSTSLFQLKLSLLVTPTSRWEVQVRDIWGPDGEPVKVKKVLAAAAAASEADTLR